MTILRKRSVRLAAAAGLVTIVILYGLVSFLIAQGVTKADRKAQEDHPSNYGLVFEDVEFPSRRGDVMLSGWYLPVEDSAGPHLIFVHGLSSDRSGDNAVELAARMVEHGYNVLLFDLRGHGSSEGDKVSGGYFERWDVLGAFDYLVRRGAGPGPGPLPPRPVVTRRAAAELDPDDPSTWGRVPRNAPCPCGSGKKYKHCHGKLR